MNWSVYLGFLAFSSVSGITPGPNNLIALASGAAWGYGRTLPHVLGVTLGFALMLILIGAGLGALFTAFPLAYLILKWASLAYLLYLAWKIATADGLGKSSSRGRPMTILGSAAFQWVNPKAWMAALTIVSTYAVPEAYWPALGLYAATNLVIAFVSVSAWALFGSVVKAWLGNKARLRAFNVTMAVLLVLSLLPAFLKAD